MNSKEFNRIIQNLEKVREARKCLESIRVMNVSKILNYKNLHHTIFMIYYAEDSSFSEEERERNLLRTIAELELVYRENKEKINPVWEPHIKRCISCARNDVYKKDYWAAISDVSSLEDTVLKEIIPNTPLQEDGTNFRILLAQKLLKSFDERIVVIKRSGKENPYNEDYLR